MSLYTFSGDGIPFSKDGPQFSCTALNQAPDKTPCTAVWPPLLATGPLVAKGGVHQRGLGHVVRNGVDQVTYFGKPVYSFVKDAMPGQMNGEDVAAFNGTWYLDSLAGSPAVNQATVQTQPSPNGTVRRCVAAAAHQQARDGGLRGQLAPHRDDPPAGRDLPGHLQRPPAVLLRDGP